MLPETLTEFWVKCGGNDVVLTGQRLFRRSAGGSDSFSETSSIGPAEDTTREGSTSLSGTLHPPAPPPPPEEQQEEPAGDVVPQEAQEEEEEEVEEEEERQPGGPEEEQSGR